MSFNFTELVINALRILNKGEKLSNTALSVDQKLFNKVLECLHDDHLAENITFARGGIGNPILMAWYDDARITTKGMSMLGMKPTLQNVGDNIENETNVFLSYSHMDKNVADEIDAHFTGTTIHITRDIRDAETWQSISTFMREIRENDFAVLIVSDTYLKSAACMYEVIEVMKEQQYSKRILPIVLNNEIYDIIKRTKYIQYWEGKCEELRQLFETIEEEHSTELASELKHYNEIASQIGTFLKQITDMKNPNVADACTEIEKYISRKGIPYNDVSSRIGLSEESKKLIKEASLDSSGIIIRAQTLSGTSIETNGKSLVAPSKPRELASLESALYELIQSGLIIDRNGKGEVYSVTDAGYKIADSL